MKLFALALLLPACASCSGRYLMVMDTSHGTIIWARYKTLQACEQAARESDESARRDIGIATETRCTTRRELDRRDASGI